MTQMQPIDEKLQAFDAAQKLLSRNDDDLLRYVALELRRCLEAVVYEKLLGYRDWIPADVARTWQPPQAFKALVAMEPDAEESHTISVAQETQPGALSRGPYKQLGVDHRPKSAWLSKTWNKLGSSLHAQWPFARSSEHINPRAFFETVIAELEPFVHRSLTATLAQVIDFRCSVCDGVVKVSERSAESAGEATCLKCSSRFVAKKTGDGFTFYLDEPSIVCKECQRHVFLPSSELRVGYQFSCRQCGCNFEIAGQVWEVRKVGDTGAAGNEG